MKEFLFSALIFVSILVGLIQLTGLPNVFMKIFMAAIGLAIGIPIGLKSGLDAGLLATFLAMIAFRIVADRLKKERGRLFQKRG